MQITGSAISWEEDDDGNRAKAKGHQVNSCVWLPTDGNLWELSFTKRKSVVNKRKVICLKVDFPTNSISMIDLQTMVEVFSTDVTKGDWR